jgi:hypothetical protein
MNAYLLRFFVSALPGNFPQCLNDSRSHVTTCYALDTSVSSMGSTKRRPSPTGRSPSTSGWACGRALRVAVEAASAVPWTTLSPAIVCSALVCALALVSIRGGGPEPVGVEVLFAFSWPNVISSVMRVLRNLRRYGPRPLAVAALACAFLSIFDSTLGFPGEGPTGMLHEHDCDSALLFFVGLRHEVKCNHFMLSV